MTHPAFLGRSFHRIAAATRTRRPQDGGEFRLPDMPHPATDSEF